MSLFSNLTENVSAPLHRRSVRVPVSALALCTFSKCVEVALEPLRHQGKRILFYLYDLLILSRSEEVARTDTMTVIKHFTLLGLAINWEKSSPFPCRRLVYLGIDSVTLAAKLSPPRQDAVLSALSQACVGRRVTSLARTWSPGFSPFPTLCLPTWSIGETLFRFSRGFPWED